MPLPLPWKLLSPDGQLYFVEDRAALLRLAKQKKLSESNLLVLVRESRGNLVAGEKSHEQHWVLFDDVRWLRRGEAGELVYTLGATRGRGSGKLVVDVQAKARDDMPFTSYAMVDKLLNSKNHKGKKLDVLHGWRVVDAPDDAEDGVRIPHGIMPSALVSSSSTSFPLPTTAGSACIPGSLSPFLPDYEAAQVDMVS
jgi:hypothetical protein